MDDTCAIEQFQHVTTQICRNWGTENFRNYLDTLTFDLIRFNRRGFTEHVFSELGFLYSLHDEVFPQYVTPIDPWSLNRK
jgi:hypothetical protein